MQNSVPQPPNGLLQIDQQDKTITIFSSDANDIDTYTIVLIALTETNKSTGSATITFTLNVVLPDCANDNLSITYGIFSNLSQFVYDAQQAFTWTDFAVTSSLDAIVYCKPFTWTLSMMDGTNIDSSIFTVDTSSSPMMSLAIYTDDINKVERYTFEVSVHYSNYVLASTTDSFDVDI